MIDVNTGYKFIAAVSLTVALFSCGSPANSGISHRDVLNKLDAIQAQLAELQVAEDEGCSTEAFLNGECAANQVPDDASAYTTFCISQGSAVDLGAEFAVSLDYGLELGGGWAEVGDVKATANLTTPVWLAPAPAVFVTVPSGYSAGGSFGIGRGMDTCVDVPIELSPTQVDQLVATINAANEDGAKYERRLGRVLDFAETRTISSLPIKPQSVGYQKFQPRWNEDDAFDIADAAVDRFLSGSFAEKPNREFGSSVFGDQIFLDLATSLDLPQHILNLIEDPLHPMHGIRPMSNLGSVCSDGGITADVRSRFDGIDNLCATMEGLPSFVSIKNAFNRIPNLPTAAQVQARVRTVVCNNVVLSSFGLANCP